MNENIVMERLHDLVSHKFWVHLMAHSRFQCDFYHALLSLDVYIVYFWHLL